MPKYDFNWQTAYRVEQPLKFPTGTKIHAVAHFDNSTDNLNNPNPKRIVFWGDQTYEEMMIGYFDMATPRGSRSSGDRPAAAAVAAALAVSAAWTMNRSRTWSSSST